MASDGKYFRTVYTLLLLIVIGLSNGGCTSPAESAPQLRIINSGKVAIANLSVLFPEDEIHFGDISPGTTTDYYEVPNGVYGYAAYRFELDGQMVIQPVMDWVGEVPLKGDRFTYEIDFSSNRSQGEMVRLLKVSINE